MAIEKLKSKINDFFYKIKYLTPLFFLCFILIDYFFVSQYSFSLLFWINSFAVLLSLVWILICRRNTDITLKKSGLTINSYTYEILFPWLYMEKPYVTHANKDIFLVNLSSVHPGQSFHVKKYQFSTEGKRDSDWMELKNEGVQIKIVGKLNIKSLRQRIEKYINKKRIKTGCGKINSDLHGIVLGKTDRSKGIVTVNRKANIAYPTFCPLTGNEVSTELSIGGSKIPVSAFGQYLWNRAQNLKLLLSLLIGAAFILLGYITALSSAWIFISGALSLSLLYIWGWSLLRKRIKVIQIGEENITLKFDDLEYSNALINMNYPFSESLI